MSSLVPIKPTVAVDNEKYKLADVYNFKSGEFNI